MKARMRRFRLRLRTTLGAGTIAAALLAVTPAIASQQPTPPADETDKQGAEPAATTSLFSAASLETRVILSPLHAAQFVPNMVATSNVGIGSANAYYLRGLGSTESIATFDPAVGTAIDGIYLSRQNATNFNFFDIERLEVRRGPQGTHGGKNALGGTVEVILKRPERDLAGYAEIAYGAFGRTSLRGSLNLPLSPGIALKISGYYQDDSGYVSNGTTGERLNDSDTAGLRAAVRMDLTDRLEWNGSVAYMRSTADNIVNFTCDPANPANCNGRFATTGLRTAIDPLQVNTLGISGRKADFGLGNLAETLIYTSNFEWRGDSVTLSLITGYVDMKEQFNIDFADGRALPTLAAPLPPVQGLEAGGYTIANDGAHRQFSQEVKIAGAAFGGALRYTAGAYLLDETSRTDFADTLLSTQLPADRTLNTGTKSIAGYIEGNLAVSTLLTLTAGIRYTDETRTFRISDNRSICNNSNSIACLNPENLVASNGTPIPNEQKAKLWTPRFAIDYQTAEDLRLFASATRGFRSGGWNARGTAANLLLPFAAETVWTYETGLKSTWFDQRLQLNVTGFYLINKDMQAASAIVNADTGAVSFLTQNVADYRNRGLEIELATAPIDGLGLFLNMGLQDGKYSIDASAPDFNATGVKSAARQQRDCLAQLAAGLLPLGTGAANATDCAIGIINASGEIASPVRTPKLTLAAGGSYDFKLPTAGIILTPSINAIWRSRHELTASNAALLTSSATAAYLMVNAALIMKTDDDNWTLAVECQNCFDADWQESSFANLSYLSSPRYWQVRMKRVF